MRKFLTGLLGLTLGCCGVGFSQDYAPNTVVGNVVTAAVTGGSAPFVSSGGYKLITSASGTNYSVAGHVGGGFGFGSYNYTKLNTNTAALAFLDAKSGPGISLSLTFTAALQGTYSLMGVSGSQTGTFALSNYIAAAASDLYLPTLTNNQFQAVLSGRDGFVYSVETSADLANWTPWTNATISDQSTQLATDLGGGSRFFRSRTQATAFAPDSLTNKTFNQTILDGMAPLATNGAFQWITDTNDGYEILGLAGVTNSSGTYSYARTGPDSGLISYADSLAGNVTEQLLFTSPTTGSFYATNLSGIESGTFTVTDGPDVFLGNIHFNPDASRSGSVYFPADGTPMALSVTNSGGWIWTLSLPADALLTPRTITMVPSASVDSSAAAFGVTNGVQLEPNGLYFCDGVTLSVTPPSPLSSPLVMVGADEDGGGLYFTQNTNVAGVYSTVLYHFSSEGASDDKPGFAQFLGRVTLDGLEALYDALYHESLMELDDNRFPTPPEPPDYGSDCNGADDAAMDDYVETILNPPLSQREAKLEGLAQQLTQLTGVTSFVTDADNLIQQALTIYEQREVSALLGNTFQQQKILAVAAIEASVVNRMESYGMTVPSWWGHTLQVKVQRARDYYEQKVGYADFSMVNTAVKLGALLSELEGDPAEAQASKEYIAGLLTFDLTMDLTWTFSMGVMEAQGDVTIKADPDTFALTGNGTIGNNSGTFNICTLVQNPFTETVAVNNWDMQCKGDTLDLALSPLAMTPAMLNCPDVPPYSYTASPLRDSAGIAFASYGGMSANGPTFNVAINSGSYTVVDQTFAGDSGNGPVTLHLTLKQTPMANVVQRSPKGAGSGAQ